MTRIAETYAEGLYSLAKEEGLTGAILEQLKVLSKSFEQEPEFIKLLAAPNLSKQERIGIIDESFRGRVEPYVLNFMKILTEKGYIRHFSDCCTAFRKKYNDDNNILTVRAVTAVSLNEKQVRALQSKLEKITGKTVELSCRVDEALLGGVLLDYDGKRVDGTIKNRLDSIGSLLENTVL